MHDHEIKTMFRRIERKLDVLLFQGVVMHGSLEELEAQVKANTDIESSAVLLIQGIASDLAAAKSDPAKVQALSDKLKASADALASAITANTTPPSPAIA